MTVLIAAGMIRGRASAPVAGAVMPNSRLRCTNCRQYKDREGFYRVSSLEKVCSEECFLELRRTRSESSGSSLQRSLTRKPVPGGLTRKRPKRDDPSPKVRAEVVWRDGGRCRYCGAQSTVLHHINYRSEGVDHSPHNLIVLCQEHHDLMHSNKRKWKPLLLMVIWYQYVYGRYITVRKAEALDRHGE